MIFTSIPNEFNLEFLIIKKAIVIQAHTVMNTESNQIFIFKKKT